MNYSFSSKHCMFLPSIGISETTTSETTNPSYTRGGRLNAIFKMTHSKFEL